MAHNTFENDSESANNANYVASVKRQKAIRRYIKLFFRVVAAIAILVLAVLVVLLALELDHCKQESAHTHYTTNQTCEGLAPDNKWCLTKRYQSTWDAANSLCSSIGQTLPSKDTVNTYPWLEQYLTGTWANKKGEVFKSLGETAKIWNGAGAGQQEKEFFCVTKL